MLPELAHRKSRPITESRENHNPVFGDTHGRRGKERCSCRDCSKKKIMTRYMYTLYIYLSLNWRINGISQIITDCSGFSLHTRNYKGKIITVGCSWVGLQFSKSKEARIFREITVDMIMLPGKTLRNVAHRSRVTALSPPMWFTDSNLRILLNLRSQ
jgi:hypothetical protein